MMDIGEEQFMMAANAWKLIRKNKVNDIKFMNQGGFNGLEAVWVSLINDFNCVMNNEIPIIMEPLYMYEKKKESWKIREPNERELQELDCIAELLLDIENNFDKLKYIYNNKIKFRKLLGISTWN